MASLTGTLDTVNSGKPIAEGQRVAPSFLSGLADWASKAIPIAGQTLENIGTDRLKSNVTKTMTDAVLGVGGAEELKNVQKAEEQGSVPVGTASSRIEAAARKALAANPGREYEVYKTFSEIGMLPPVLQRFNFELNKEAAGQQGVIGNTQEALKAATAAGFDVREDNLKEAEEYGLKVIQADREYKMTLDLAQLSRQGGGGGGGGGSTSKTASDAVGSAALQAWYVRSEPILSRTRSMVVSAGDDPARQSMIVKLKPQLYAALEAERSNIKGSMARAGITDIDSLKAIDNQFDADRKSIDDLFGASFTQTDQIMTLFQNQFKLDSRTALRTYSLLSEVFGQATVNSIFQGDFLSSLPQETRDSFAKEIEGFAQTSTMSNLTQKTANALHMTNLIRIFKGQTKLSEITSADARKKLVPALVQGTIQLGATIKSGGGDAETRKAFLNSSAEISTAASFLEISNDPQQQGYIRNATNSIAHPEIAEALKVLKRDNPVDPVVNAQINASRTTAAKLIKVTYNSGPSKTDDGVWEVKQGKDGMYYTQRNDAAAKRETARLESEATRQRGGPPPEGFANAFKNPPLNMKTKVDNLNLQVGFLVRTHELDDEGFKNVTPVELRLFYGHRDIVPQSAKGDKVKTVTENWMDQYRTFEKQLQEPPKPVELNIPKPSESFQGAKVSVGDLVSRFRSYGVPDVVAAGIIGNIDAESSFDPRAVNPTSGAKGLIQWLSKDRLNNAKNNGFDLNNVEDQIAFIIWELNNSESRAKQELMKARTPQEAAEIFAEYYVRPEGASNRRPNEIIHIDRRRNTAVAAFGSMQ